MTTTENPAGVTDGAQVDGASSSNNTTAEVALTALTEALRTVGEIDASGKIVDVTDDARLGARLIALGPDVIGRFTDAVRRREIGYDGIRTLVADHAKRQAASLLAGAEAVVEPIPIGLDALGEVDLTTLTVTAEPACGPYLDGLIAEKGLTLLVGRGGVGKTWAAEAACLDAEDAVYLDLDGNGVPALYGRLQLLGASDAMIRTRAVNIVSPVDVAAMHRMSTYDALVGILRGLEQHPPKLIVIDSFAKAMDAMGGEENSATDVNRLFALVERLRTITSVIIIDHVGHEAATRPRGASAKIDTPDFVLLLTRPTTQPGKGEEPQPAAVPGRVAWGDVVAVKDRTGALTHHVGGGAVEGFLGRLTVTEGDPWQVSLATAKKAKADADSAASVARMNGTDPESQRRRLIAALIDASDPDGIAPTALAEAVTDADDEAVRMPRAKARAWVNDVIDEWTAAGRVGTRRERGGMRVVGIDPDDDNNDNDNEGN
ncbi:AAA domain-containing protein [Gordonia malaquae]|uniref:AAA+ ATPase domain-containing protein n=1 Tax=Gordonia malaquae NBRC 108250 TaxID=1223542 RepID=M3UVK0_GORML|nr:AAA family ATPase [Gordonia malaquae]GAC79567.1 hypothetical protein GM1_010_01570 [Gordonia malaquae NBRC 108250]SEC59789.1 AAA domain-containing protein [Gordonia malaquae]